MFGSASNGLSESLVVSKTEVMRISGAVSPAARATASTVAVTIPPSALGRMTLSTVRQRLTPSASAASRRLLGTSSSTSWLPRAISGSMMIASATEPAKPDCCVCGFDEQAEDEEADDDRGQAVHQVERQPDRPPPSGSRRTRSGRAAISTPIGIAIAVAIATIIGRCRRSSGPIPVGAALMMKSRLIAPAPRATTV